MDLKQLEYFVYVAQLGSFTRASIALDIAQSALSRQIRLLEVELGQCLLVRNGRGVGATDAGKLLLEHSQGILYKTERLKEELGKARGALVGHVALGLPPSLIKILAVPIVREFKAKFPVAALSIREGLTVSMQESLVSGRLDVALLYNANPSPDIDLLPLLDEELFLVEPRRPSEQGGGGAISIEALAGYPLIIPSRPNAIRMLVEIELSNLGIHPNIALEIDGVGTILDLVNEGFGNAVLSQNAVCKLAPSHEFTLTSIKPPLHSKLSLAVNSRRQITATQQALIELTKLVVSRLLGDSEGATH